MTECWEWPGRKNTKGYGTYGQKLVHRYVYELIIGEIPKGYVLDHLCRVRHCINPKHLDPVTSKENTRRGLLPKIMRERQLAKIQCPQGHPYAGDNLYLVPTTKVRQCRKCRTIAFKKFKEKAK